MVIPGYTGYIPRKYPQQVFGCTYVVGNSFANAQKETISAPESLSVTKPIPGYKGFVAGKASESFIEEGFGRVWRRSERIKEKREQEMCSVRKQQHEYYKNSM